MSNEPNGQHIFLQYLHVMFYKLNLTKDTNLDKNIKHELFHNTKQSTPGKVGFSKESLYVLIRVLDT